MASYNQPCQHCGQLIESDVQVCPVCASGTPFSFNCPDCRRQVGYGQVLCSGCGRDLKVACPTCGQATFAADDKCSSCQTTLMALCPNRRCGQRQFFQNSKCTACGKKIRLRR